MTLEDYFINSKPQRIDASLVETGENGSLLYASYQSIDFEIDGTHYAKILIAHPAPDIWALGFEIKDGIAKAALRRDCTPHIVTKGKIDKLVYGMTKVLKRNLTTYSSKAIRELVDNAEKEAYPYYVSRKPYNEKITI